MSDYTPTTETMRRTFAIFGVTDSELIEDNYAIFDRWLAEVKAKVWEQGYIIGISTAWQGVENEISNPYRQGKEQ